MSADSTVIRQLFDNWSAHMSANTLYSGIVFVGSGGCELSGGSWNLIGCKTSDTYEWQIAIKYSDAGSEVPRVLTRCKSEGAWKNWKNII